MTTPPLPYLAHIWGASRVQDRRQDVTTTTEDDMWTDGWYWDPPQPNGDWQWSEPRPMLVEGDRLVCPDCCGTGIEWGEDDAVIVYPNRDDYEPGNPLRTRGGYTVIRMTCTCGAMLAIITGNHKGMVAVGFFSVEHREMSRKFDSPIEAEFWRAYWKIKPPVLEGLIPQYPVNHGQYFIDFALPSAKVGIELDGHATHSSPQAIANDRKRQRDLESAGWRIIRFGGSEIAKNAPRCVLQAEQLVRQIVGLPGVVGG